MHTRRKKKRLPQTKKAWNEISFISNEKLSFTSNEFFVYFKQQTRKNQKHLGLLWESNPSFAVSGPMSCPLDHQRIEIQTSKLRFYYQLQRQRQNQTHTRIKCQSSERKEKREKSGIDTTCWWSAANEKTRGSAREKKSRGPAYVFICGHPYHAEPLVPSFSILSSVLTAYSLTKRK